MNAADELRRTEALLEELERLVGTGTLTGPQLEHLDGSVAPPLFVRARILRRAAGDWQTQATRQLELSELGWHRMPAPEPGPSVRPLARTITALYDTASTGWLTPSYGAPRSSLPRGLVPLVLVCLYWFTKGKRR